jgi:hypothetical protein
MYIEMTTFAVPTFLISAVKALAIVSAVWVAVVLVGITIYKVTAK